MPAARSRSPTGEEIAALREVVERLVDRVDHLTFVVDELSVQLQWSNNQQPPDYSPEPPFLLTSLPLDPAAKDWQINRVRPEDLPAAPVQSASAPGRLF